MVIHCIQIEVLSTGKGSLCIWQQYTAEGAFSPLKESKLSKGKGKWKWSTEIDLTANDFDSDEDKAVLE